MAHTTAERNLSANTGAAHCGCAISEYLPGRERMRPSEFLPVACQSCVASRRMCDGPYACHTRRVAVAPPYKGATSATVRRQGSTALLPSEGSYPIRRQTDVLFCVV
jgi:hypothetical protein